MKIKYIVKEDSILSMALKENMSKKMYKSLKAHKIDIYVNGNLTKLYQQVRKDDIISFDYDVKKETSWDLYESNVDVVFEDDNYLVVNKRRNLLTIPTEDNHKSLYQELLYYLKNKGQSPVLSFLNRLDYQTSGLILIAKNKPSASRLSPTHEHIIRRYNALLSGILETDNGQITTYIDKEKETIKRYVSNDSGKIAITNYKVIKRNEDTTLVEFELQTGRTHQIRVHSLYLSHPIVGDKLYNNEFENSEKEEDLFLCSNYLSFDNYGQKMEFFIKNWWEDEKR